MPVKLIAVDMDGTFLNSEKKYDKARFLKPSREDHLQRQFLRTRVGQRASDNANFPPGNR